MNTVKEVIDELQSTEGGDIPTFIDGESLEQQVYVPWTVHPPKAKKAPEVDSNQMTLFPTPQDEHNIDTSDATEQPETVPAPQTESRPQQTSTVMIPAKPAKPETSVQTVSGAQTTIPAVEIDREAITKFINEQGYLTYIVRSVKINNYLKSLLGLAGILTQSNIFAGANDEIETEVVAMMREYIDGLHKSGAYDALAQKVLSFKLAVRVFDVFGESLDNGFAPDFFTASESDLDRQLRAADARLGAYGFPYKYGRAYGNLEDPSEYKIDCILFASDDECIGKMNRYAEAKFHELNDKYRKYVVTKDERCKKQYSAIVADGDIVSKHNFALPETISVRLDEGGKEYSNHLFADENGIAKIKLNNWESGVLEEEAKANDFVCWIRNPSRGSWSLCIPYEMDNETQSAYPDFLIVRSDPILTYVLDILEPHDPSRKDNLGKAKGFARYAAEEPRIGRIQLIRQGKDAAGNTRFKRLDLAKGAVREKVLKAQKNDELDHIFETDGEFKKI